MVCAIFVVHLLLATATSLEIACGWFHNCVFERGQNAMKCWGSDSAGELGYDDTNVDRGDEAGEMGTDLPLVDVGSDFLVEDMCLSDDHTCAMSDDRAMKCFGSNAYSELGFDGLTTTGDALPFLEFGADFNLSRIAAGDRYTCVLSTDAQLKCFGANYDGQCGAGTTTTPISGPPSQIAAIDFGTNFTPIDVQTFNEHVCVLSPHGTVKCFGWNAYGQLGYGDTIDRGSTPASMGDGLPIVDLGSDFIVAAIATGNFHSCALSTAKTVKCWGRNNVGQCGTPHSRETGDDLPVLEFGADFVPVQLAVGSAHTCILSETARLLCFGYNYYGQLGIGSTSNVDTPSTLTGIDLGSSFVPRQVAAGYIHTCAVSTGDDIKCWGSNQWGTLGLGHANTTGDDPDEMGDNLPFVNVAWPSPAPTTAAPSTAPPSTEPTKAPTTEPTTKQPSTISPTTPPVTVSTAAQTTAESDMTETGSTTTTSTRNNHTVSVTIRTDSLSSTQILIAIANAYNLSSTTLSSNDDAADGFATVELLVAVPSGVELDYDVIEATLREAMVDEYGDDIEVDVDVHGDDDDAQAPSTTAWSWGIPVAASLGVCVCVCCVAAVGLVYVRRQRNKNAGNVPPPQPAAAAVPPPPPPQQVANMPGVSALAMTRVVSQSASQVVPGAAADDDNDGDDDDERKQGEEDVELEMAPIKKQAKAFVYDPDRNYKPEGARASLVTRLTPGVNRKVAVVEEEKSDSEELYAGNNDNNNDANNTTRNSDDDMYDDEDIKTRTAKDARASLMRPGANRGAEDKSDSEELYAGNNNNNNNDTNHL